MKNRMLKSIVLALTFMVPALSGAATEWSTQDYDLYGGDFNGDGKTDLLYVAKDPSKPSGIALSDGSGPNIGWQSWPSNYLGIPWYGNTYNVLIGDFNGDGKSDIFLQRTTAGDSYLLLTDSQGRVNAIAQTVASNALGLTWTADQHKIVVGDFTGDGRADVFLQATSASGNHSIVSPDTGGTFTVSAVQTWADGHLGLNWSVPKANVFAGKFNNDANVDLLVQAKPKIVMIDYDIPIPVPTYQPNSFGLALSQGSTPFPTTLVPQLWSHNANGVDWAPTVSNIIVGDFNGDGISDVILQARNSSRTSYLLTAGASGTVFSANGTAMASNVTWSADTYKLITGNFDGTGGAGVFFQSTSPTGANSCANTVTGSSVSTTAHSPGTVTGVLPTTAVGRTVGSFAVTDSGAATYSIPIVVPPGVSGVQPSLAINYSSGGGNGLMGVGWSISGLSEINRCGSTLAQDGVVAGVTLTSSDKYCLDGNKLRLTSGTYGAVNSTYQTEMETFARVTASPTAAGNGPASFTVEAKNGLKYEYGSTADSRIEVVGSSTPKTWALNKMSDRYGNTMTISYFEDTTNGSFRPNEILYTSNSGASLNAAYKVVFVYDTRPTNDVLAAYEAGGIDKELNRLNHIETKYNDPVSGWRVVRKYLFSYQQAAATLRSRLTAVQECEGVTNTCLAPTSITWTEGVAGWVDAASETTSGTDTNALLQYSHAIDIDGDGRTDLVYPKISGPNIFWYFMKANSAGGFDAPVSTSINAGSGSNPPFAYALPIDLSSDGRQGLLVTIPGNSTRQILRWNGSTLVLTSTNISIALQGREWIADFDGDGRQDFMYIVYSGTGNTLVTFYVQKNSAGSGTFAAAQSFYSMTIDPGAFVGNFYGTDINPDLAPARTVDFNGDGKADFFFSLSSQNCEASEGGGVICFPYTYWYSVLSTGNSFVADTNFGCSLDGQTACPWSPMAGDFNGDGISDVVYAAWDGSSSFNWYLLFGTGTGLSASPVNTGITSQCATQPIEVDYDGDGRSDLMCAASASSGTWSVYRSTGQSFDSAVSTGLASSTAYNNTIRAMDLDGDGLIDIGYNIGFRVRKHLGASPDMASSVTDGFGNSVVVTYLPLTASAVYTKGAAAVFPEMDLQAPMRVVSQYSSSDGIGGSYVMSEKYSGARVHLQGRGMEGFASRTETDGRTNVKRILSFNQQFPLAGLASSAVVKQPNDNVITQTTNTYTDLQTNTTLYADRHFPYVSNSVQTVNEVSATNSSIDGAGIKQVTAVAALDSYGNQTSGSVTTADLTGSGQSFVTATTATFASADTTNWCFNVPTEQQVTSTVPGLTNQTRTDDYTKDTANPTKCRIQQKIVEPTQSPWTVTTTYEYDSFGHPYRQTVAATGITNRVTTTSFGTQGVFPTSVTNAASESSSIAYDYALGVALTTTDANGLTTTAQYDNFGRKIKETKPDGTATSWTMSACGTSNSFCGDPLLRYQVVEKLLDTTSAQIRYSTHLFDSIGRSLYDEAQTLSGALSYVAVSYDNQGRVLRKSAPFFPGSPVYYTTLSYDLVGRPLSEQGQISESNTGTQTSSYGYSKLSNSRTDANGKTTTKNLNAIGQVVSVTDAANGSTSYQYDQFGNLWKTTDARGNVITNTFNIRGFKTATADPDMGSWSYDYFPTGELKTQTDAKSQTVQFTYDPISRPLTRVESEGTTTFTYGTSSASKNVGAPVSVSSPGGYSESYTYDSFGRPSDITVVADTTSYAFSNTYGATTGLLDTLTYPTSTSAVPGSRFKVQYEYAYGLVKDVKDANASTIYWQANATNAAGQAIDEQLGNGLHTYSAYDAVTGMLSSRTTGASAQVQNLAYQWDKVGNLTERKDLNQNLTEDFVYDDLYRLDHSTLNGVQNLALTYDAGGNIASKSDVGSYTYPTQGASSVRPHAVSTAGSNSYSYDANGNMSARNGDVLTWYSYNLPNLINKSSSHTQFFYGASRARYKQIAVTAAGGSLPTGTETTIYIGSLFEKVTKPSAVIEYKHSIQVGKDIVAIRTLRSNSTNDTRYLHKDHLGSVDAVTNESGTVLVKLAFDAFGRRRNATGWTGAPSAGDWTSIAAVTHRGFTFHEQLDNVDLVHMNGRVYDPNIGRFISADPIIQAPLMSQSLNRYSYCLNNPLSMIDPSGYSWLSSLFRSVHYYTSALFRLSVNPTPKNLFEFIKAHPGQRAIDRYIMTHQWAYVAGQTAATIATWWGFGFGGSAWASYYTYIGTGSLDAAFETGVVVFASSAMSSATGKSFGNMYNGWRLLVDGLAGGITAGLGGGDFWQGFELSVAISSLDWLARVMRAAMVEQSRRNPLNSSGQSDGMYGDHFKAGGGRAPVGSTSLDDFAPSPLGGRQGGPGSFFGHPYAPGSLFDHVIEQYAGPHDFLSSFRYTADGMLKNWGTLGRFAFEVWSFTALVPATVFAVGPLIPPTSIMRPHA